MRLRFQKFKIDEFGIRVLPTKLVRVRWFAVVILMTLGVVLWWQYFHGLFDYVFMVVALFSFTVMMFDLYRLTKSNVKRVNFWAVGWRVKEVPGVGSFSYSSVRDVKLDIRRPITIGVGRFGRFSYERSRLYVKVGLRYRLVAANGSVGRAGRKLHDEYYYSEYQRFADVLGLDLRVFHWMIR